MVAERLGQQPQHEEDEEEQQKMAWGLSPLRTAARGHLSLQALHKPYVLHLDSSPCLCPCHVVALLPCAVASQQELHGQLVSFKYCPILKRDFAVLLAAVHADHDRQRVDVLEKQHQQQDGSGGNGSGSTTCQVGDTWGQGFCLGVLLEGPADTGCTVKW